MPVQRDDVISELAAFAKFLGGLHRLVRRRMSVAEALSIIQTRLDNREANFLTSLEGSVYTNPRSPYRALLAMAGCTIEDVRELLKNEGLDGTLTRLRTEGVYVSFEEFKGLTPIVRGSLHLEPAPGDFDNPSAQRYFSSTTGGSTGTGRRVRLDLKHLEAVLPTRIVVFHVQGLTGIPTAAWMDLPPAGLKGLILDIAAGEKSRHWFITRDFGWKRHAKYRAATHATLMAIRLAGGGKSRWPKHVPLERAVTLARWCRDQVKIHGACMMYSSVSGILRIAIAARENDIDMTGVILRGGGEPPTSAKVAQIVASGATFYSSYAFSEVGTVGSSCLNATGPNDQHFMEDHLAMIQATRKVPGFDVEVPAFCFTSLLPTAAKMLLNVESDDYGSVDTRPCGCTWEKLGFSVHIRDIRSFRKLTGEGITLVGSDIERVLDQFLPGRYGGSALDYQFAEEEDSRGFTRIIIRVAPHIVVPDERKMIEFVLDSLRQLGGGAAVAEAAWRRANTLAIRREIPAMTSRGKLLPLDIRKAG
ncbi:MAG TPA: hypothetical protein VM099_14300 [Gemmatimonadaceae bacterium]|nr:hypothetical protein [Gemmatimonadaceae bacterium]